MEETPLERDVAIMLEARSNTPRPCVEQQMCVVSNLVCSY